MRSTPWHDSTPLFVLALAGILVTAFVAGLTLAAVFPHASFKDRCEAAGGEVYPLFRDRLCVREGRILTSIK